MKINSQFKKELLDFSLDMSYEAGEILLKFQKKRQELELKDKGAEGGIASEADQKSEEYIIGEIRSRYPEHYILSEEDYSDSHESSYVKAMESELAWVIDPLDGTNNFVNGIPIYAISIAVIEKGMPILGVVYNPTSGECFYASEGEGAYLIDFRINPFKKYTLENTTNEKEMGECIFSPAPVYEASSKFEQQLSVFRKNIMGARAVRRLGSAALELCYVANGNFDGYWEKSLKPWDVAAAGIILKEANVEITDFNGKTYTPFDESIIAAVNPLHRQILGKLSS